MVNQQRWKECHHMLKLPHRDLTKDTISTLLSMGQILWVKVKFSRSYGAWWQTRTADLRITNALLYQLSQSSTVSRRQDSNLWPPPYQGVAPPLRHFSKKIWVNPFSPIISLVWIGGRPRYDTFVVLRGHINSVSADWALLGPWYTLIWLQVSFKLPVVDISLYENNNYWVSGLPLLDFYGVFAYTGF